LDKKLTASKLEHVLFSIGQSLVASVYITLVAKLIQHNMPNPISDHFTFFVCFFSILLFYIIQTSLIPPIHVLKISNGLISIADYIVTGDHALSLTRIYKYQTLGHFSAEYYSLQISTRSNDMLEKKPIVRVYYLLDKKHILDLFTTGMYSLIKKNNSILNQLTALGSKIKYIKDEKIAEI
jgi:hypothetical protein